MAPPAATSAPEVSISAEMPPVAPDAAPDAGVEAPRNRADPTEVRRPERPRGYDRRPFRQGPVAPWARRPDRAPAGPDAHWTRTPSGPPPTDLVGEDEELIAGRHPVEEAFLARRAAHRLLVVPQRRQALEKLVLHATSLRIPIVEVEGGTLTSLAGFDGHQGIALVSDKRRWATLDDLLARAIERKEPAFALILDSLEDPQNFGSLLRTAEAAGVHGVVFPTRHQAPLSAAAIKASAGAVEHLLLVPVDDLAEALADLHIHGLRVIGSEAEAPLTARQADLRGPVAIVVGSEGQGLGPAVRRRCDAVIRIPMRGRISSLNAAVAGSILLYEASSQRGGERSPLAETESQAETEQQPEPSPEPAVISAPPASGESAQVTAEVAAPAATPEFAAPADPGPATVAEPESDAAPTAAEPAKRRTRARRATSAPDPEASAAADEELLPGGPAPAPVEDRPTSGD
jgi:23S rRNA (guanosine2251-2'-O)-methyltransferase